MRKRPAFAFLLFVVFQGTSILASVPGIAFTYYGETIQVNEVLIHQQILRDGPEALLITNEREIRTLAQLFSNNRMTAQHLCGAHLGIEFRESAVKSLEVYVNLECDEYLHDTKAILNIANSYYQQLRKNPTHYQYCVEIAKGTPLSYVQEKMKGTVFTFYRFPGPTKAGPVYIRIIGKQEYSKTVAQHLKKQFAFIRSIASVGKHS